MSIGRNQKQITKISKPPKGGFLIMSNELTGKELLLVVFIEMPELCSSYQANKHEP
jgi:hypothetical protein